MRRRAGRTAAARHDSSPPSTRGRPLRVSPAPQWRPRARTWALGSPPPPDLLRIDGGGGTLLHTLTSPDAHPHTRMHGCKRAPPARRPPQPTHRIRAPLTPTPHEHLLFAPLATHTLHATSPSTATRTHFDPPTPAARPRSSGVRHQGRTGAPTSAWRVSAAQRAVGCARTPARRPQHHSTRSNEAVSLRAFDPVSAPPSSAPVTTLPRLNSVRASRRVTRVHKPVRGLGLSTPPAPAPGACTAPRAPGPPWAGSAGPRQGGSLRKEGCMCSVVALERVAVGGRPVAGRLAQPPCPRRGPRSAQRRRRQDTAFALRRFANAR